MIVYQGVNEQQTAANMKPTLRALQENINVDWLHCIKQYLGALGSDEMSQKLSATMQQLEESIANPSGSKVSEQLNAFTTVTLLLFRMWI